MLFNKTDLKKLKFYRDLATNLYNKNFLIENKNEISNIIINNISNNIDCSILFCDIDGLRLANDLYGHLEADKGIKKIADIIKKHSKKENKNNFVIRFGGDEFVAILFNCNKKKVNTIVLDIETEIINNKKKTKNMTLSVGAVCTLELNFKNKIYNKKERQLFFDKLLKLAEENMQKKKLKNINQLTYEERKNIVLKKLHRLGDQMGFDMKNPKNIDYIIDILKDIKKH